jgi:GDP-fucose transporter C1
VVTFGFFVGVFLDAVPMALLGVGFGVASSAITAAHSVVIKKSLDVVKGSAMNLSWYTNLFSAMGMIPLIIFAGEVPAIKELFFGQTEVVSVDGELSELQTFIWGSFITVCVHLGWFVRLLTDVS